MYTPYHVGARLRDESRAAGAKDPNESKYILTQFIGDPLKIWTGNDLSGFKKVRTEQRL